MAESNALAMVEFKSIGLGLAAVDRLVKTYPVELLFVKVVCPGKLLAAVSGDVASVREGASMTQTWSDWNHIDQFFLGNPHPSLYAALKAVTKISDLDALGILETFTASAAVLGADLAAKAAPVQLLHVRLASGLAGRGYVYVAGSVGAVTAAFDGVRKGLDRGLVADMKVVAHPSRDTWRYVL